MQFASVSDYNNESGEYPFGSSATSPFYPPVCLKTHWDPTQMLKHVVPSQKVDVPLSFRPFTKICLEYKTTGPVEQLPHTPADMVFPPGGDTYTPSRYIAAVDEESKLRRLDRPLRIPEKDQYVPPADSDMFNRGKMAPDRTEPTSRMVSELSMPKALLRAGPYSCRAEVDAKAKAMESKPFNNPTKMSKYNGSTFGGVGKGAGQGAAK